MAAENNALKDLAEQLALCEGIRHRIETEILPDAASQLGKGSIIANGNLVPDPYYVWKSLNYSSGWIGKVSVDPNTGNPVYAFVDPYTGMIINYYMDPKTGNPVYTNEYPTFGFPYYGMYSSDYGQTVYALPSIYG